MLNGIGSEIDNDDTVYSEGLLNGSFSRDGLEHPLGEAV